MKHPNKKRKQKHLTKRKYIVLDGIAVCYARTAKNILRTRKTMAGVYLEVYSIRYRKVKIVGFYRLINFVKK